MCVKIPYFTRTTSTHPTGRGIDSTWTFSGQLIDKRSRRLVFLLRIALPFCVFTNHTMTTPTPVEHLNYLASLCVQNALLSNSVCLSAYWSLVKTTATACQDVRCLPRVTWHRVNRGKPIKAELLSLKHASSPLISSAFYLERCKLKMPGQKQ